MDCLRALSALNLPQGYLGAGFVRNAIWDDLHNKARPTPLNDIDVVYFSDEITVPQSKVSVENTIESLSQPGVQAGVLSEAKAQEKAFEHELARFVPNANWQVKNQARMHLALGHAPYKSCSEAISYWIERETCVAVRLLANDDVDILAPFGLEANFAGTISINPKYPRPDVFEQRVVSKNWPKVWPLLKVVL
ncbi:MAG: nucleotidyltransferase family protein [Pseudomonadota bacterium]|nr:nucleotidyltransferase family protein [Pseudomonadota bacterium]